MGDNGGEGPSQKRRRLKTPDNTATLRVSEDESPRRDRSRSGAERRSRSRSRNRSRTVRTRNSKSQGRDHELLCLRAKLETLEREVRRDRESRAQSRLTEPRLDSSRSRSRYSNKERDAIERPSTSRDGEPLKHRSSSRNFSTEEVAQLVNSIKNNLSSHPPACTTLNKHIDHKNILPNFDPSSKNQRINVWLKKVNECAAVYGWDDKTTIHFAMQKLQGLAKVWYESLDTILFSWPEWQEKLINAFPCEENYGQILEEMLKRKSKFNEPIEVYYYEKLALLHQCGLSGKKAVDCIIHGITERTTKSSAVAVQCSNPDQLLQFLISNKDLSNQDRTNITKNRNWTDNSTANNQSSKNKAQPQGPYCFNCKEKGHHFSQCSKPLLKCQHCSKVGHKSENCFKKLDNKPVKTPEVRSLCSSGTGNSKFFKNAHINGVLTEVFVDFGSEVTLVKESFLSSLAVGHDKVESIMKGFGNGLVKSLGGVWLDFDIDGVRAKVPCKVVKDNLLDKSVLVGQSFTELPHIIVYKDLTQLRFMDIGNEMPQPDSSHASVVKVSVAKDVELYGPASIKAFTNDSFSGNILIRERLVGKPGQQFVLCGGMYSVKNGVVNIIVAPCCSPCLIMENFAVCRVERVASINRITMQSSTVQEPVEVENITESKLRIGDNVSEGHKHRLLQLLNKYKHCFASKLGELGCTNVTQMTIDLNDQRPIASRPYRLSHHEREQVRSMIDEMLKAGIIRESTSEYASPIILVRKPDGSLRMCIDYRKLNSITVKERYPMPIIDDEIARLSGQGYFITLDLASGYYQVPIAEQSKHLTSFVTPDGQFEFNRMPFGLANAPAVFQRMMNRILGSARFTKATVYIDDLLIFGRTPNECLDRLEEVLQMLEKSDLTLNLSKCSFLREKIDYLGYEISAEGVRPGEKKIESVKNFPRPIDVHKVRQFLGLVGFFRKFIEGFAQIAYPLTKLLKKDAVWEWTSAQEDAFDTLKDRLISRPILAIYDPTAELELHTDASKHGIGGILLQKTPDTNDLKPIAFYSRKTSPEEKNFHSYELETLAVVCSLKKFRVYLLGKDFKVMTDCSALRSTFSKRDLIPRIARWWLMLQEFTCSIEYRAGLKMLHVDALSRNPTSDPVSNFEPFPAVMNITHEDWLLTLQLADSELSRTRNILMSDVDPSDLQHIKDNYVIKDNRLFRCIDGNRDELRWVVPKGARWQVCKLNHDDIGHFGIEKTLEKIKKQYWFPKMKRFVKKYVTACIECAYSKQVKSNHEGLLHPIEKVDIPFHTLHADHLGPFVRSKRGNSYLLVVVDAFTKFAFARPVRNTKTLNVIRVLDDIFFTFKAPVRLVTDRGSCFTSHSFRKYCADKGIKHILNAVASPKSNGQVERYNRTILNSLTAQNLNGDERDWDSEVGKIQWGMNNTINKTTGRMPSEVLFGTFMSGDICPALDEISQATRERNDLGAIRKEVKDKIDSEQIKQKAYYDKGRRPARCYNEGDLVKITKISFKNDGKSRKLLPAYVGPFRVTKILGNDRYKIASVPGFSNMKNGYSSVVAADRMRPWVHVAALEIHDDTDSDDDNSTL